MGVFVQRCIVTDSRAAASYEPTLRPLTFVPELRLYLLDGSVGLWDPGGGEYRSDRRPPFWAFAWAGGQALARYLLDHPDIVAGRRVLDVGCGSGVVGIAAAVAGAAYVCAIDVDEAAVAAAQRNATANGVALDATYGDILTARRPVAGNLSSAPGGPNAGESDVVVAGDVCYTEATGRAMGAYLVRAARAGARVLVGDPDRSFRPNVRFRTLASYDIPVARVLEGELIKTTNVLEVDTSLPTRATATVRGA
jgi:predicted nicotinamide N-methyase